MSADDQIQIQLAPGGLWHRRSSRTDRMMTVCGLRTVGTVVISRDQGGDKDNDLCPVCFGREEIDTAEIRRVMREHGVEGADLYYDDDEEPTIPGEEEEPDSSE